jgi:outer membrane protein
VGLKVKNNNLAINLFSNQSIFMKQFILLCGLIGFMSFGALAQKFGHIDAQNLLLNLPERAEAQASIESTAMEMTRMQEDLQNKYAEYQAKAESWPAAIRESKEREIQGLDRGLQEFGTTVQAELSGLEESLLSPMIARVRDAIEAVGSEHGFTYIFDASMGATLYNGGEDVTDLVRTKLGM